MGTLIVDAPANEPPHRYLLDFTPAGPIKSPNPRPASEQTTPDLVAGAPPAVTVRTASPKPGARRSFWRSAAFLGLVLPGLAAFGWSQRGGNPGFNSESVSLGSPDKLVYHSVQRHDLPITITERGTLSSQQEIRINCDLETVPGQSGTRILWIVPNGTAVKAGEPLVEFDSAPLKDRLNTQSVVYEQARAAQIQASVRFENQKTQNETNLAAAKLRVEVAQLGLTMYEDESGGAFKIAISDLDSKIQEARNQISEAQAALKMKHARRKGVETLFKLGYRGKGDLDQATHDHLQADFALVKSTNSLSAAEANKKKLKQYEYPMKVLELKGAIATAERALAQVLRDNEALMAQTSAARNAADRALITEEEKLKKYQDQLSKSKVLAPLDGLVAHSPDRTPWGRLVADGELVTERFKILTLPDLARMQVKLAIHESAVDQVKTGLEATVRIDAFPDVSYDGTVRSVAVLPTQDSSLSSDVKVYDVLVTIDQEVDRLKPGMTAVVDIHVRKLDGVLTIPVQAVIQEEDETWCFVGGAAGLERRSLKLGLASESHVQVLDGLAENDRVVLNPAGISPTSDGDSSPDR